MNSFIAKRYPNARIVDMRQSYFSEIVFLSTQGNGIPNLVIKKLVPNAIKEASDSKQLAHNLARSTSIFIQTLSSQGVELPKTKLVIYDNKLYMVSAYAGVDLEQRLFATRDPNLFTEYTEAMLNMLTGPLMQNQTRPVVGLDLQFSNFGTIMRRGRERVVYLDPFPPLVWDGSKYWVHFPQPLKISGVRTEIQRKFQRVGTLRRLRFDVMRINLDWEIEFYHLLIKILGKAGQQVVHAFRQLPDTQIKEIDHISSQTLIQQLGTADKDTLRELSARILPNGRNRQKLMHRVFSLSRADPSPGYEQPHQERVEILKQWLLRNL